MIFQSRLISKMTSHRRSVSSLIILNFVLQSVHVLCYNFGGESENSIDEEGRCDHWAERFSHNQRTITAKLPPDVHGKWVSERCEVRPGPEFLIRKYEFSRNDTFVVQQFFYTDESCTTPAYAVTSAGKFRFTAPSWVVPGGMNAEYLLTTVAITGYSRDIVQALAHKVNTSCPGFVSKSWKPYRTYRVYSYIEVLRGADDNSVQVIEDIDCISGLHVVLHELQLVRVEHRKPLKKHHQSRRGHHIPTHEMRSELLLGDIHTEPGQRLSYHPTSYQSPLLKPETSGCHVCHLVSKSTSLSPPQLHAQVKLPVYMSGEWISSRCETRPYGMFIMRRLSFYGKNHTWRGQYRYFSDPKCSVPTFKIVAGGRYSPGNPSIRVHGGTEYNFYVDRASITPQSNAMVNNLKGHLFNTCGQASLWEPNKSQDLTFTGGCLGLGLRVPATEFDLVKMEIDNRGNTLLHLGHVDTNNKRQHDPHPGHEQIRRPTSYQTPLFQCQSYPSYHGHSFNAIYPRPYRHKYRKGKSSASNVHSAVAVIAVKLVTLHLVTNFIL